MRKFSCSSPCLSQPDALARECLRVCFPSLTRRVVMVSLIRTGNPSESTTLKLHDLRRGRVGKRGHELFGEGAITGRGHSAIHWANLRCTVENDWLTLPARLAGARLATLPRIGSCAMVYQRAGGLRKPRKRNFRTDAAGWDTQRG